MDVLTFLTVYLSLSVIIATPIEFRYWMLGLTSLSNKRHTIFDVVALFTLSPFILSLYLLDKSYHSLNEKIKNSKGCAA